MSFSITSPNFTQFPNDMADKWLPFLTGLELKVLIVIIRKTIGYHKIRDKISLSQLVKYTGATMTNIGNAINKLIEKKVIKKTICGELGSESSTYELIVGEPENNEEGGTPKQGEGGTPKKGDTKETYQNKDVCIVCKEPKIQEKKKQEEELDSLSFPKKIRGSVTESIESIRNDLKNCPEEFTDKEIEVAIETARKMTDRPKLNGTIRAYLKGIIKNTRKQELYENIRSNSNTNGNYSKRNDSRGTKSPVLRQCDPNQRIKRNLVRGSDLQDFEGKLSSL